MNGVQLMAPHHYNTSKSCQSLVKKNRIKNLLRRRNICTILMKAPSSFQCTAFIRIFIFCPGGLALHLTPRLALGSCNQSAELAAERGCCYLRVHCKTREMRNEQIYISHKQLTQPCACIYLM